MKTTILAAAVLMALGFTAHAETSAVDFSDTKTEAPVRAKVQKADSDEASAKSTDVEKKSDTQAASKEKSKSTSKAAEADAPKSKKISGFQDNNGVTGDLEVGVVGGETVLKFTPDSCKTGTCTKVVLFNNKNLDDMRALRDALGESTKSEDKETLSASERRRLERKNESEANEITEKEVREEIALRLSVDCGIDEENVTSRSGIRDSRSYQSNINSVLGNTQFAGLQMPEKSPDSNSSDQFKSDAECSASVLKDFMAEHEVEDVTDLKDKLSDLKLAEKEWKLDLRREDTKRGRDRIQKKLDAVKEEIARVQKDLNSAKKTASAYDRATLSIAKRMIINPAVSDLATHKFFTPEDFFLHDLAATTPDSFKGVRKAASNSLLDIYRLQSQSYLAFNEMANKTTDPAQKLQLQQAALHYQAAGANYNAMMSNPRFRSEIAQNASQAGLDSRSILEEMFVNTYNPGAAEISRYLMSLNTNGTLKTGTNQALPQVLMVQNSDGTYSQVTVTGTQAGSVSDANARGQRVGGRTTGIQANQAGTTGQLARPVPLAPNAALSNQQQRLVQQPMIQSAQPVISMPRVRGRQ